MDLSTLMPQQLQIVKTLDRPLFVSAGAGSGKTFTLTRRIVYALSPESVRSSSIWTGARHYLYQGCRGRDSRSRAPCAYRRGHGRGSTDRRRRVDLDHSRHVLAYPARTRAGVGHRPEFTVLTDTDELMDQAVEHVLGRATAPDAAPELAASLKALYAWYPMAGEGGPFGAGTTIKGLVREMLELSSQLPGGMDDVCVARGQADTSALADAYRAALGASKAATEKAQTALDAIDAFEASGKTWPMRRDS